MLPGSGFGIRGAASGGFGTDSNHHARIRSIRLATLSRSGHCLENQLTSTARRSMNLRSRCPPLPVHQVFTLRSALSDSTRSAIIDMTKSIPLSLDWRQNNHLQTFMCNMSMTGGHISR